MLEPRGGWSEERISMLGRLFAEGLSAAQIAAELGGGVTRNAVIGRLHRSGLTRSKVITAHRKEVRARSPRVNGGALAIAARAAMRHAKATAVVDAVESVVPLDVLVPAPVTDGIGLSLIALRDDQCHFPVNDEPYLFCAAKNVPGSPYCAVHHRTCHQPEQRRQSAISEEERTRRQFQARRNAMAAGYPA